MLPHEEYSYLKRRIVAYTIRYEGGVTRSKLTTLLKRFSARTRNDAVQELLDTGMIGREFSVTRTGPRTQIYVATEKGRRRYAKWKESGLVA